MARRWREAHDDQALEAWGELAEAEPRNLRSLYGAAQAYGHRFRIERALEIAEQIRGLDPGSARVLASVGDLQRGFGFLPEAHLAYEAAAACPDATPEGLLALADSHGHMRQFDAAHAAVRRAVDIGGATARALLTSGKLYGGAKEDGAAEAALLKVVRMARPDDEIRVEALGELALLRDRQGDFEEAFRLAGQAKEIHLGRCGAEKAASDHVTRRFAQLADAVCEADFARWAESSPRPQGEPSPVALTGFPRSGTTLLEQVLDAHPQVTSSEEIDVLAREIVPSLHGGVSAREPLMRVLDQLRPDEILQFRKFYWRALRLPPCPGGAGWVHIDKNPAYNLLIPFFLRLFPEARLLVAVRDPRDVVISCYLRYLPLNPTSVSFLTLGGTAHRYALDMTAWLRFSTMIENRHLEVRYEDVVEDVGREARRVCETIGVPWHADLLAYREKLAGKAISSPTYADVQKPIYTSAVGRWRNYRKFFEPHLEALAPFVEEFGYGG